MAKVWTAREEYRCRFDVSWTEAEVDGATRDEAISRLRSHQELVCGGMPSDVRDRRNLSTSSRDVPDPPAPPATHRQECLDANDGTGAPYMHENPNDQNPNHLWSFQKVTDGTVVYYMIVSRRTRGVLDANNGAGPLYLHNTPDFRNDNHLWSFRNLGFSNLWMVVSKRTGGALDANNGGEVYLHSTPTADNDNHRWFLWPDNRSGFMICRVKLRGSRLSGASWTLQGEAAEGTERLKDGVDCTDPGPTGSGSPKDAEPGAAADGGGM